jgi:hypothetical protein
MPQFLFSPKWKVGLYRDLELAQTAAEEVRRVGVKARVAPVWVEAAYRAAADRKGARSADSQDVYLVDDPSQDAKATARATIEHVFGVLHRFDADGSSVEPNYSAVLAASFLTLEREKLGQAA